MIDISQSEGDIEGYSDDDSDDDSDDYRVETLWHLADLKIVFWHHAQ